MASGKEVLSEAELLAAEHDAMLLFDKFFDMSDRELSRYERKYKAPGECASAGLLIAPLAVFGWVFSGVQALGNTVAQSFYSDNAKETEKEEFGILSDEKVDELVFRLKRVGDLIDRDLQENKMKLDLQNFIVKGGSDLAYEEFSTYMDEIEGFECGAINEFLVMMHLSKRVIQGLQSGGGLAKTYFKQYLASKYKETVALNAH